MVLELLFEYGKHESSSVAQILNVVRLTQFTYLYQDLQMALRSFPSDWLPLCAIDLHFLFPENISKRTSKTQTQFP